MSICNNNALKRCRETRRLCHEWVNFKNVIPNVEFYFLFQSDLWCVLTLGVEFGCCTWSHWITHTYTHKRTHIKGGIPLDEGTDRGRDTSTCQCTTPIRYKYPCLQRDSSPQSQPASGRRPTFLTARPLRSEALFYIQKIYFIFHMRHLPFS